jgi:hypothetical protein
MDEALEAALTAAWGRGLLSTNEYLALSDQELPADITLERAIGLLSRLEMLGPIVSEWRDFVR